MSNIEIQPCLMSSKINLRQKTLLFKIRTRMVASSENFGLKVPCKFVFSAKIQFPMFSIVYVLLKIEVPQILSNIDVDVNDVFDRDMLKVNKFVVLFEKAWRKREEILM